MRPAATNWLTRFCSDEMVALVTGTGVVASTFAATSKMLVGSPAALPQATAQADGCVAVLT